MGGGLSKHEDEIKVQRKVEPETTTPAQDPSAQPASGCPMHKPDGSYSFNWSAVFSKSFPHGPNGTKPISESEAREKVTSSESNSGGCPVQHQEYNVYSQPIDPKNNMPAVANQLPAPVQSKSLPTERVQSTIGKGGTENSTWTYPSPQMFYNALARKGKLGNTDETDIVSVVALHNNMNEKTWKSVCEWERVLDKDSTETPKLLKFLGRPSDLSPKAAFKHYVLGHPLPFDRHDWTVVRANGTTVRYVIDYYHDETMASEDASSAIPPMHDAEATPSLLVDVRPALDGPMHLYGRAFVMPYARHVDLSTQYQPLPLRPTSTMVSQVAESVQVWENIQSRVQAKAKGEDNSEPVLPEVSMLEAKKLARNYAKVTKECKAEQSAVEQCEGDEECERRSMDLTMCLGKVLCPVQHQALVKALMADEGANAETKVEAALSTTTDCVMLQSAMQQSAKKKYPRLF